ncbi:MAG: Ig-like domain-containing protein [bacterium]
MLNRQKRLLFTGLLLWYGCANQVAPSGGPVDKTPPKIIHVTPENKATLVPLNQPIEFEFSESMDRRTAEKAVFISPDPGDNAKIKWKGHKLRIEFKDSLKTDLTYVITLGTDLKDARGNPLSQSYTLAFSTGAVISDGKINGRVFADQQAQGVLIWAYLLGDGSEPDPGRKAGDYVTQTDGKGNYQLSSLSPGSYRLFAIRDADNNRFFEKGVDGIGVAAGDIRLMGDTLTVSNINFRIATKDTIGPALLSVAADHNSQVTLQFDEALDKASASIVSNYRIRSKAKKSKDTLAVRLAYLDELENQNIILLTAPQRPKTDYQIVATGVSDQHGNPVDPDFNTGEFLGSVLPDTFPPKIISFVPKDSAKSVFLNATIDFNFDEPVNQLSFERSFSLSDSAGFAQAGRFDWVGPAAVKFQKNELFRSKSDYRVVVKLDSVSDLHHNAIADSTLEFIFSTIDEDTLSSLSGVVIDEDSTATGAIFLTARQTTQNGRAYDIQLNEPGPYRFTYLLPGTYSLEGFRDSDNNGEYSFGQAFPFQPAERFVVYPDTVKIRARWPNEGNDIIFTK